MSLRYVCDRCGSQGEARKRTDVTLYTPEGAVEIPLNWDRLYFRGDIVLHHCPECARVVRDFALGHRG